jgi:hypothetical protein
MSANNAEILRREGLIPSESKRSRSPQPKSTEKKKKTNAKPKPGDKDYYKKHFIENRSKYWLCTWFDMTHPISADLFSGHQSLKAYIYQLEKCPKTNRLHFQSFFEFNKVVSLHNIQTCLKEKGVLRYTEDGQSAEDQHALTAGGWAKMRGSIQDNIDYCSKSDTRANPDSQPTRFGTFTTPEEQAAKQSTRQSESNTKKNDELDMAVQLAKSGTTTMTDIWTQFPLAYVYHYQNLARGIAERFNKPRDRNVTPEVIVYFGPPGCGKTRKAVTDNPNAYMLHIPRTGDKLWFDGYAGQDTIILDEFVGQICFRQLLALIDRYERQEQIKGGFIQLQAHRWIFTSNIAPDKWYPARDENLNILFPILRRRIAKCYQWVLNLNETVKQQKAVYDLVECESLQNPANTSFDKTREYLEELHKQYYDDLQRGENYGSLMIKK